MNRLAIAFLLILLAARFCALDQSPPGFYIDEASQSAHVICMATEGANPAGRRFPLYSVSDFGGVYYPPALYIGAGWVKLFGASVAAMRAFAAFAITMAILGMTLLARHYFGNSGALATALVASVSPWGWIFSRIAWEPPNAPCFLVWALYFFLCREGRAAQVISAVFFALAIISYSPLYIQGPIVIALLLWMRHREGRLKQMIPFAVTLALVMLPFFIKVLTADELRHRFRSVSLLSENFRNRPDVANSPVILGSIFARNYVSHFHPDYLFLSGDRNPRHSTGKVGILSALDFAAIAIAITGWRRTSIPIPLLRLCIIGILAGIIPSALTLGAVPHALRSIGAWPFVCLLSGAAIRNAAARAPILAAAVLFSGYFLSDYFTGYPQRATGAFDEQVKTLATQAAREGNASYLQRLGGTYSKDALLYYQMAQGGHTCSQSFPAPARQ
ncbi:MAG: glycosyltransferase family 39 protein [Acidobacteria bacterium]|nr:glycosyltransferase family 39 protein [Acidobacteriota bacterium]